MELTTQEFHVWFSALASVKGCFVLQANGDVSMVIRIKQEDAKLLRYIQDKLGGTIVTHASGISAWRATPEEFYEIIDILDEYPMLTRKQADYKIWKKAAVARLEGKLGVDKLDKLANRLSNLRDRRVA